MRRLVRAVAMSLVVGQPAARGRKPGQSPSPSIPVTVTVTNNGNLDADVYAIGSNGRYHLGFVPASVTAKLFLPSSIVAGGGGTLRLLVRRIAASRYITPPIQV